VKTIAITGGSSGIGYQLAKDLLARGDNVIIIADDKIKVEKAHQSLNAKQGKLISKACDVRDFEGLQDAFLSAQKQFGNLDVLVNNAGFATYRPFEQSSLQEILDISEVNFTGVVKATKAVLPFMQAQGGGHIVNIASLAGKFTITPNAIYCGAKHGVVGLSGALRHELRRFQIQVSVVCPGRVNTNFCDHETFQRRSVRPETSVNTPIDKMSKGIIKVIDRPRKLKFIPGYWSVLSWMINSIPFCIAPFFDSIHRDRIECIYKEENR
jgi:short-subunit dehydrogenase